MNRAKFGDLHKSAPLAVSQFANQRDLNVNLIGHPFLGITCCTILSMDSRMAQSHLHTLERPLFSICVHAKRHAGTGSQCGQKQFIRIWPFIITPIGRLVRLKTVLPYSYRLKKA